LLRPFADPAVGGVCGQRAIRAGGAACEAAQRDYIRLDSRIKLWESRAGSLTSSDGKLYAIRRGLFRPLPDGVTDDLYNALTVIRSGYRFIFAPGARVLIPAPSRSLGHEVSRRRRIVCRSLRGLWLQRSVFNPFRHGGYALRLFANKVLRRALPGALLLLVAGALLRAPGHPLARGLLATLAAFLALALLGVIATAGRVPVGPLRRPAQAAAYALAGLAGTLLGWIDLVRGRAYTVWDPRKTGS
jgi:hypothetical protein